MSMLNKQFSDIITFTRASAATRVNAQGLIETVAANVPRIDYDPVTLECKGLLIEEQRTNLFPFSEIAPSDSSEHGVAFQNIGTGFVNGMRYFDISYAGQLSEFTFAAFEAMEFAQQASPGPKCLSFNVEALEQSGYEHYISAQTAGMVVVSGGWQDYLLTSATPVSLGEELRVIGVDSRSAAQVTRGYVVVSAPIGETVAGSFRIWARQIESGLFPTSYIPTAGAQVTRAADVASINMLSPWFGNSAGTIYAEISKQYSETANSFPKVFSFDDGGSNNEISIFSGANLNRFDCSLTNAGVNSYSVAGNGVIGINKVAVGFSGTSISASCNGSNASQSPISGVPAVTKLNIGKGWWGGDFISAHVRKLRYFPNRLTDAQLQAITAP